MYAIRSYYDIVGYVVIHDLSSANVLSKPETPLAKLVKPIQFVRETENCLVLLTHFLTERRHIAMIGDEYGGVNGLVTLEDVLETVITSYSIHYTKLYDHPLGRTGRLLG